MSQTSNLNTLFCSVCSYLMLTHEDQFTQEKYNCCHDCYTKWIESRKEEWLSGWRPELKEIELYKKQKQRIIYR